MKPDTIIKNEGTELLIKHLGLPDAQRYIMLIQREPFDYTKWRENLLEDLPIEKISRQAMEYQQQLNNL
ncbi:hypothetical protein FACS1894214_2770 [Planctomycetales bacterium]|nr:hypothetical protein FACS1894214_2770 [Planctomycetales bacterium]